MTWEPGYREVPATDPPDYQPGDGGDGDWEDARGEWVRWDDLTDEQRDEAVQQQYEYRLRLRW